MDEKLFETVMSSKPMRKEYLEDDFLMRARRYFRQYFNFSDPRFNIQYAKDLQAGKNVFFESFRWSAKTTWAQMYIIRCISYRKRRNIMRYSYNGSDSEKNIWYITNMLIWSWDKDFLVHDRWQLYYDNTPTSNKQKRRKTVDNFVTENEVYVRALSLGISPRWDNFTASDGKYRPDLLVFDDVDIMKSVSSTKIIDKNWRFLEDEVFGWITSNTQIIFLGNTINQDGVVPRMHRKVKDDPRWAVYRIPIYDPSGQIQRDRFVETDAEADRRNDGIKESHRKYISLQSERDRLTASSFSQNYLLIPYLDGESIIKRHMVDYNYSPDGKHKTIMGVDPAFSEKTTSDPVGIAITHHTKKDDATHFHNALTLSLKGTEKSEDNVLKTIESLYHAHDVSCIIIEWNNGWELIGKRLKKMWLAVVIVYSSKDKVTKLREKERYFEKHHVHFNDAPGTTSTVIDQIIHFPTVDHDDEVDALLLSMDHKADLSEVINSVHKAIQTPIKNNWNDRHSMISSWQSTWSKF